MDCLSARAALGLPEAPRAWAEAGEGTGVRGACLIARQNLVHPCGSCSVQDGRTHPSGHTFPDRLTTKQTCGVPTSKVFTPWIRVPRAYMALEDPQLESS